MTPPPMTPGGPAPGRPVRQSLTVRPARQQAGAQAPVQPQARPQAPAPQANVPQANALQGDTLLISPPANDTTPGPVKPVDPPTEPWTPPALPIAPEPEPPAREVSATMQARIGSAVGGLFAGRPLDPPAYLVAPIVFDPSEAFAYGDGSFAAPDGRAQPNAPKPGAGAVTPPGLKGGNTLMRYDDKGAPSNFTILDQGDTNGCGTTSLAMALNFLAGGKVAYDREKVDASIRHFGMFTSPADIAAYAERQGLKASVHTGTTVNELCRMIDQGLPVEVLMDVHEAHDGAGLHYEVVTGYGKGPDGKRYLELANPWGQREYMAEDAFMARWSDLSAKGFPLGIDRVAIALKPPGSRAKLLSDDRHALFDTGMTALRVGQGLTQITSGFARRDPATLSGGVVRLVAGGLLAIPTLLAGAGGLASRNWIREGRAELSAGQTLPGLGRIVGGGLGVAVTYPLQTVGNVLSAGVDWLASGVTAAGRGIGKTARQIMGTHR